MKDKIELAIDEAIANSMFENATIYIDLTGLSVEDVEELQLGLEDRANEYVRSINGEFRSWGSENGAEWRVRFKYPWL